MVKMMSRWTIIHLSKILYFAKYLIRPCIRRRMLKSKIHSTRTVRTANWQPHLTVPLFGISVRRRRTKWNWRLFALELYFGDLKMCVRRRKKKTLFYGRADLPNRVGRSGFFFFNFFFNFWCKNYLKTPVFRKKSDFLCKNFLKRYFDLFSTFFR